MLVDRSHRAWAFFSVGLLAVGTIWYLIYAGSRAGGVAGGTFQGLGFGIAGTTFMLFALLLGLRKRRPQTRVGRVAWWLKGHLWLGALSFPLIFFHCGFDFGGPVTQVMMWLFIAVFITGLYGLALQQVMPRLMTKSLPLETIYEQIDLELAHLLGQAEQVVEGRPAKGKRRPRPAVAKAKAGSGVSGKVVRGAEAKAEPEEEEAPPDRAPLEDFLGDRIRPYFLKGGARGSGLEIEHQRIALLAELRRVTDSRLHDEVASLEALCEQKAQIDLQQRLHRWLHWWLLVHVPFSYALLLLTAVHAVMSLYY